MKNEALSRNLPPDGYEGGLILDEMSIQSDLEFCSRDGNVYLWGFKEVTDESYSKWLKRNQTCNSCSSVCFSWFHWFSIPPVPFPDRTG